MTGLVIALWPEARPVVERFGLRPAAEGGPFRLYRGDGISLVVSGIGKVAAAAATSYLFAMEGGPRRRPWLNFGIAGHRSRPVGEGLLAARVEDRGSGRVWYPCPLFDPPAPFGRVATLDRVEEDYPADAACEMEAAGFYATAARFSLAELVHVYKVVSDGPETDKRSLNGKRIVELVAPHLDALESLVRETGELAAELEAAEPRIDVEPWLERWRFSVSQGRRLELLLRRLEVLRPGAGLPELAAAAETGAQALELLEEELRRASPGTAERPEP